MRYPKDILLNHTHRSKIGNKIACHIKELYITLQNPEALHTAKTQGYPYSRKTFPIDAHLVNEQVAEEKQKPEKDTAPRLCNNSQQNLHNTFAEENFPSR